MKAVELISRILSLQLVGNPSVILTDGTLVHRFHGLRDLRIINSRAPGQIAGTEVKHPCTQVAGRA